MNDETIRAERNIDLVAIVHRALDNRTSKGLQEVLVEQTVEWTGAVCRIESSLQIKPP